MIHLQKTVPDWTRPLDGLPKHTVVKTVDEGGVFQEVKAINPNINTCLRHWYDDDQVFGGSWDDNVNRARIFFATFIDGTFKEKIAPYCDFVEEFNEYLANSQTTQEVAERILWAKAAAWVWKYEYRVQSGLEHIRLALCSTAIGNWIHKGFAEIARDYDCLIAYHPYDYWKDKVRGGPGMVAALSMLWDAMEFDWDIRVDWIFTEAGPFEAAEEGWQSNKCLGFDRELYVEAMRIWIRDVQQTPAYKEGRIHGFALFTTGRTAPQWDSFGTIQPELDMLGEMVEDEWHPGTNVPEPPVEPPIECIDTSQYTKYHLLRPREMSPLQWDKVKELMEDGTSIPNIGKIVIGYEGWSHLDAMGSIRQSIEDGFNNSRLIILDGDQIGSGLDYEWMEDNCPLLAPYTVWLVTQPVTSPTPEWLYPVQDREFEFSTPIGSQFGDLRDYDEDGVWESLHEGVDLRVNYGNPIVASRAGTVVWASYLRRGAPTQESKYGWHVVIEHDDNYITWYAHMNSLEVQVGDVLNQGDVIGYAGSTGYSSGVHLHFAVQHIGHGLSGYILPDVIDPEPLLS